MSPLSPLVPASGAVLPPLLPREWRGACSAAKALSHVVRICDSGWLLFFIRSSSSGYLDKDTLRMLLVFFLCFEARAAGSYPFSKRNRAWSTFERFLLFEQQRVPIHRKRGGATQSRDRTNASTTTRKRRRWARRWGAGGWRARGRGESGSGQTYSAVSRAASGRTVSRGGRGALGRQRVHAEPLHRPEEQRLAGEAAISFPGRDFFFWKSNA